jgi:glucose/arabinose dehydrogenase
VSLVANRPQDAGQVKLKSSAQAGVRFKIEKVVGGLEVPWSIVWAPDGRMIFTERPGRVRVFEKGALNPKPLFVVAGSSKSRARAALMSVRAAPAVQQ